ncbi:hypothetical protein [Actinotalea solisilvae]|uniref:hypothetical protein n=1 Tax=Actinotalea solisilvae TaxID=2072922 RepID=UPI0018F15924|nr:hypothetical protein [Actinotalea solisilvae]
MKPPALRTAVVGLLVAATLTGCALTPVAPQAATQCDPPAPPGVSQAAQAYANATHEALLDRIELSDTIAAQNMMMSLDDMRRAAEIDQAFLADVRAIRFPEGAAAPAQDFIAAVEAEDEFLLTAAAQDGWYGAHLAERGRLDEERGAASRALRDALGLPASGCRLTLP